MQRLLRAAFVALFMVPYVSVASANAADKLQLGSEDGFVQQKGMKYEFSGYVPMKPSDYGTLLAIMYVYEFKDKGDAWLAYPDILEYRLSALLAPEYANNYKLQPKYKRNVLGESVDMEFFIDSYPIDKTSLYMSLMVVQQGELVYSWSFMGGMKQQQFIKDVATQFFAIDATDREWFPDPELFPNGLTVGMPI